MQREPKSLAQRSLQAVKWNYLGTIGRVAAQLVAQIALARLLGPEVIGSFGYALLLGGLLGLLLDQGLGWALVHANSVSENEFAIVLSRVMLAAALCTLGSWWLADEIARLMGAPDAARAIRYFSPAFIVMGLSVITQAKLRKDLRFKEIQIAQTVSYFIAYPIVGVGLALAGMGVISLIAAWILQACLAFFMMNRHTAHGFRLANPLSALAFSSFGRDILAINIVNWIVDNAGAAFIGRLFGASALGLYNTTQSLVRTPANHLVVNLQTVLFPTAAAAKADLPVLGRLYSTALAVVLFVAIPVFSFVAVAAPTIVATLLGSKWLAAGALLPPIALAMIPHVVSNITGSTLSGRGDQRIELASQSLILVLLAICYMSLPIDSVVQVCWLFLSLYVLRAAFLIVVAARKLRLSYWYVAAVFRGPAVVALFASALYLGAISTIDLPGLVSMLVGCTLFGLTGLIGLALLPRFFVADPIRQLLGRFATSPGGVATIARWLAR